MPKYRCQSCGKTPKEIKKFGYPLKTYHFTGEYSEQIQGFYIIAGRNKKIVYAPIYEDEKGGTIVDMGQATNKKPIKGGSERLIRCFSTRLKPGRLCHLAKT